MIIFLGYFFTVINYICYCLSRFVKTKQMMLLLDLLAKVFTVAGLYCLNSLSGAYFFGATFFLLICANIKEKKQKKWTLAHLFFQALFCFILFYQFEGISSLLVFASSSMNLWCIWWLPPQKMRFFGGFNSILFLLYQVSIRNWAGLIELVVIYSNFAAYIKYKNYTDTKIIVAK